MKRSIEHSKVGPGVQIGQNEGRVIVALDMHSTQSCVVAKSTHIEKAILCNIQDQLAMTIFVLISKSQPYPT